MKKFRGYQTAKFLLTGVILLQTTGCDIGAVNSFIQTILLGITAAGAVVLIDNI